MSPACMLPLHWIHNDTPRYINMKYAQVVFMVIFLDFFLIETHLLFWRNTVNQYQHQWNKNEFLMCGSFSSGVRLCVGGEWSKKKPYKNTIMWMNHARTVSFEIIFRATRLAYVKVFIWWAPGETKSRLNSLKNIRSFLWWTLSNSSDRLRLLPGDFHRYFIFDSAELAINVQKFAT